jgi:acyl carrier protein
MSDTLDRIQKVFRKVLDNDELVLQRETTAADVEDWDSLNHISLIVAVEREFRVKLTTGEIAGLRNVGDLADVVARKRTP